MMSHRFAMTLVAGVATGAACSGSSDALTAMPKPIVAAFGLVSLGLAVAARLRPRRLFINIFALGMLLGVSLPRVSPPPVGTVVTHGAGGAHRGDLFELLDQIDAHPQAVVGRRVTVSGEWSPAAGNRDATVSRRVMTCCAADAVRVGFDVTPSRGQRLPTGMPVCVTGMLRSQLRDGDLRYVIQGASVGSGCSMDSGNARRGTSGPPRPPRRRR